MTVTKECLDNAANLLEEKGWTQNHYRYEDRYCMMGACLEVCTFDPNHYFDFQDEVARACGFFRRENLFSWNDHPGQNAEAVIARLRESAAKLPA